MDKKTISSAMGGLALNLGKLLQRSRPDPWALPPGMEGEEQPVSVLWTQYTAKSFPETWRETAFQSAFYEAPEKSPQEGRALSLLLSIADKLSTGENVKVLVEKIDAECGIAEGRSFREAPEVDGVVEIRNIRNGLREGDVVKVRMIEAMPHDMIGEEVMI